MTTRSNLPEPHGSIAPASLARQRSIISPFDLSLPLGSLDDEVGRTDVHRNVPMPAPVVRSYKFWRPEVAFPAKPLQ
jgi:hypothetical protein